MVSNITYHNNLDKHRVLQQCLINAFLLCGLIYATPNLNQTESVRESYTYLAQASTQNDSSMDSTFVAKSSTTSTPKNYHTNSLLFIGAGAGVAFNQHASTNSTESLFLPALDFGVRGGYQHGFLHRFAGRIYLDYVMSIRPVDLETVTTSQFVVNLDMMYNFYRLEKVTFGVFGGAGVGYGTHGKETVEDRDASDSITAQGLSAFVNVGLNIVVESIHRVEIGAKIPFVSLYDSTSQQMYRDFYLLLSYDYLF